MAWENELNERKRFILKSIIDDYIASAQPVGSRTIAKKHDIGLGSATIRNEMADLEELGYITQPHTSAGRVPSDKGYRFYVDNLMQLQKLAYDEISLISRAMDQKIEEFSQLIKRASVLISDVTGYTAVVMAPQLKSTVIKSVQLISVDEMRTLVVVIAKEGIVHNKIIRHENPIDNERIERLNNALNRIIKGKTIDNIKRISFLELQGEINIPTSVIASIEECIKKFESAEIYMEGITNILNHPEFGDLMKAREVLGLLKEEDVIAEMVKRAAEKQALDFKIGSENEIDEMKDLSVITTVYGREGKDIGTIGVIGPTRMTYGKVVSSIKYIQKLLNREIIRMLADDS
ncbi:MAG: heat-inducible transcription repressor HrcA [Clostridiaceae bacterium]|nr:heat-inducible transcription repressor HrcA [Clostridiaceae bacterium]